MKQEHIVTGTGLVLAILTSKLFVLSLIILVALNFYLEKKQAQALKGGGE